MRPTHALRERRDHAQLALDGDTQLDTAMFRLRRFASA
jgi:hypothetical protein